MAGAPGARSRNTGAVGRARWDEVVRLHLEGRTGAEIAATVGVHPTTISRTLAQPEVRTLIDRERALRQRRSRLRGESIAGESLERLRELARSDDERIATTACLGILDRFGFHPGSGPEFHEPTSAAPSQEDVREVLRRLPRHVLAEILAEKDGPPDADEE